MYYAVRTIVLQSMASLDRTKLSRPTDWLQTGTELCQTQYDTPRYAKFDSVNYSTNYNYQDKY